MLMFFTGLGPSSHRKAARNARFMIFAMAVPLVCRLDFLGRKRSFTG
jgi:hypothetical protein